MSSSPGTRRASDVFTPSERPSKRLCDGFPSAFQCDLPFLLQRSLFGPAIPSRPPTRSLSQLQFIGRRLPIVGESSQPRHKSGTRRKRQVRHLESTEPLGIFRYTTSSANQQPCSTPFRRRQSGDLTPHVASSHINIPQLELAHNNISDRIGHPCPCLATYTGDAVRDVVTGLTASHTSLVAEQYKLDGDHDILHSGTSPRSSGHSTSSPATMAFSYDTTIDPTCMNEVTSPTISNVPFDHIFTFKWDLPDRNMDWSPSERSDSDMSGSFSDSAHSTPYFENNRSLPHALPSFDLLPVSSPMAIADAAFREAMRFGAAEHGDEKLSEPSQLSPFSFPELDEMDMIDVSDWPYNEAGSIATALHIDCFSSPSQHSFDSTASRTNLFPPQHINPAALTLIGPGIFPSYSDSSQDIWHPRLTNQNDVLSCPSSASSSSEYFDFAFPSDSGGSFPRSGLHEPSSTFDSPPSSARRPSGHLFDSPILPLPLAPHGLGSEPNRLQHALSSSLSSHLDSQPSQSIVQIQKVPLRHPQPVRPIPLIRIPASTWEQDSAPASSSRDSRSDL